MKGKASIQNEEKKLFSIIGEMEKVIFFEAFDKQKIYYYYFLQILYHLFTFDYLRLCLY